MATSQLSTKCVTDRFIVSSESFVYSLTPLAYDKKLSSKSCVVPRTNAVGSDAKLTCKAKILSF